MNCKILLIILVNILYVCSSPYLNHIATRKTKFCGSKLSDAMTILCNGVYASPHKKSLAAVLEYEDNYNGLGEDDMEFPFLPKELAQSLVPQKTRRGVVNECCYNPCSIMELQSYCGK